MADTNIQTPEAGKQRTAVEIPWLKLWDEKKAKSKAMLQPTKESRLDNIEFMTMLCELEFH